MTGFDVDTVALRTAANALGASGSSADAIVKQLSNRLASLGEPWGSDDLGAHFAKRYADPAGQGLRTLAAVAGTLDAVAARLAADAGAYEDADSHVEDLVRRAGRVDRVRPA